MKKPKLKELTGEATFTIVGNAPLVISRVSKSRLALMLREARNARKGLVQCWRPTRKQREVNA